MKLHVADILEWCGAAALVAAAFIWSGDVLALGVAGGALVYFANVYDDTPSPPRSPDA